MAKKKTRKIDPSKVRTWFNTYFPKELPIRRMFGETVQYDADKDMNFLKLPAHPQIKRYVTELRPHWECTPDYIEYEEEDEVDDNK